MPTRKPQAAKTPKRRPFTVDDLWQVERLGAPSLSPDGAQLVVPVTRYSMDENSSQSHLWLLSTLGGAPRALTSTGGKDGQPRWSPHRQDGREFIAFTARREQQGAKDAEAQLYLIAPDGGEARRASEVATGVEAFKWCPDGKKLVFVSWVWPDLKGGKAQASALKDFKDRKESGYVTSEAQYRHWDRNLPMGRVPHLHLLTLSDSGPGKVRDLFEGTPYQLTLADPGAADFDLHPDGKRLVFAFDPAEVKRGDGRYALAELEIATGRVQVIVQDADWDCRNPRYSPDGLSIAFTASHQAVKHTMPDVLAIWCRPTKAAARPQTRRGAAWEVVSEAWDHAVHAPLQWTDDGAAVCFQAEDRGRTHVWRFELASRRAEVVARGGWVNAFDLRAGTLVTAADSALHPARIEVHPAGEAPRRLETFNDELLSRFDFGRVEEVWIEGAKADPKAKAGDPVQMWVTYPPGFDPKKRHPVMHSIHGGPHTGPGDNWHYRWNTQVFAAQGYVVASVNYHGSSGFGQAFLDSITHRWGELELQDIEAGTDWLLQHQWADPKRVFATGGSYGGYMVAWMNGHLPQGRYQAYVCHAGCFDWVGMFADDAYYWHAKELGSWYWDDMARVQRQSPHAVAGGCTTPTLVIHGALDYRVPDAQGLAYYNTLKAQGIDARLLWFPDENHWILKPRNSRLWHEEFFNWLKRHDPAERPKKGGRQR